MNEKPKKTTVLLVEDDLKLASLVKEFLESHGFSVGIESRGDLAEERIIEEQPELVILDWMLPGMDGLSICKEIRHSFKGPIVMLTARSDEVDEIVGLEVGADDYIAKPVRPRLLLARINTLLRRQLPIQRDIPKIQLGLLAIDPANRLATIDGRKLELTTAEFDLLLFLAQHPGEILKREDIYRKLRGIEWDGLDRSIDLRIARLRKKLGDDAKHPNIIKSVRGAGYLIVEQP
jgi:DNA-binding response OmpR family regulator